jgi:hypothetical protein
MALLLIVLRRKEVFLNFGVALLRSGHRQQKTRAGNRVP